MTSSLVLAVVLAVVLTPASATPLPESVAGAQTQTPQRITEGFGEGAYRQQPGILAPVLLRLVQPQYTATAERARIQGDVEVEAIVLVDGTIGATRVVRSLDKTFGLDDEAVTAVQKYLFRPGTHAGTPVPSVVRVVVGFRLQAAVPASGRQTAAPPPSYWTPDEEFLKGVARLGQPNVTMPVLERAVEPKYTSEAMRAKLMGTVTVDLVVAPDGSVLRTRIARSLDPTLGLDRTALDAASQWRFKAGLVNGQPANVLVTVTMEFRLH